jgi:hypothetical protein
MPKDDNELQVWPKPYLLCFEKISPPRAQEGAERGKKFAEEQRFGLSSKPGNSNDKIKAEIQQDDRLRH